MQRVVGGVGGLVLVSQRSATNTQQFVTYDGKWPMSLLFKWTPLPVAILG